MVTIVIRNIDTRINRINRMRKRYFSTAQNEIAGKNLIMIKYSSIFALLILLALIVVVHLVFHPWHVTLHYVLFVPALLIFYLCARAYAVRPDISYMVAQALSICYCVILMGFAIVIDVFPYPDSPSSFTPLIFIIFPVMIILPFSVMIAMDFVFEAVYVILTVTYKTTSVIGNDIFNSIAGLMLSIAVAWIIMKLRVEDSYTKEKFVKLSTTDLLTGLLNKMSCEQSITKTLTRPVKSEFYGLMIMDVDDFKRVNDTYGHLAGDKVLEMVGTVLSQVFRENHIVGRIGGDEFMVFINDVSEYEQFEEKCRTIVREMERTHELEFKITCSIGMAVVQNEEIAFEQLFQTADQALYRAKTQGKNQHVIYKYGNVMPGQEA
jgi:diguanylate cyclase (GGDEF)-like protein